MGHNNLGLNLVEIYKLKGNLKREELKKYFLESLPSQESYPPVVTQSTIEKRFFEVLNFLKAQGLDRAEEVKELMMVCLDVAQRYGLQTQEVSSRLIAQVVVSEHAGEERLYTEQKRKKERTRELILTVALDMFADKGYHATTMDAIAKKAKLGKGTLYRYFANKEKVFNELLEFYFSRLETRINAVFDERDDVLTIIAKYLHIYFQFFDENKKFYRLLVQEQRELGSKMKDFYFHQVLRRVPSLKRKIYEAARAGLLKDVDFYTVFYGVMGFVDGVMKKWVSKNCSYLLVDELPTVLETIFYGFVDEKRKFGPVFDKKALFDDRAAIA